MEPRLGGAAGRPRRRRRRQLRNFARDTFPVERRQPAPVALAGDLAQPARRSRPQSCPTYAARRVRFPGSRRLATLIRDLTTRSPRFAELWATGAVGTHREDHKIVDHPNAGPIAVDCDVLTDGDAERKIVILTAAPHTEDEARFQLAVVSGIYDPAHS